MESDLSLTVRLWDFASSLGIIWFAAVTSVVLVIEQLLETISPSMFKSIDKRWNKESRQKVVRLTIILCLFYSAFQAYDDVNSKYQNQKSELATTRERLAATERRANRISASTSRLSIGGFDFKGSMDGSDVPIQIKISNNGAIPANVRFALILLENKETTFDHDNEIMNKIDKILEDWEKKKSVPLEIRPTEYVSFTARDVDKINESFMMKNDDLNKFTLGNHSIKIYGYVSYDDDALDDDKYRVTRFCALYKSLNQWFTCPGLSGTSTRTKSVH